MYITTAGRYILMDFIPLYYNRLTLNYKFPSDTTVLCIDLIMYAICFSHIFTVFRHYYTLHKVNVGMCYKYVL
jgi:hypothetical protein